MIVNDFLIKLKCFHLYKLKRLFLIYLQRSVFISGHPVYKRYMFSYKEHLYRLAKYFRACAVEVCVFSHEIFRFASEIQKVYLTSEIEKATPIRMQKKY